MLDFMFSLLHDAQFACLQCIYQTFIKNKTFLILTSSIYNIVDTFCKIEYNREARYFYFKKCKKCHKYCVAKSELCMYV